MRGLAYIDVCSGISAPTMGWKHLGWKPLCYAEIDAAPRAVLKHHYPDVPLRGDFTQIKGDEYGAADLLVGGTPCQSFSIAGLRKGMDDERGNLALEYIRLAQRARTRWVVWENVPGVLTSSGGEDLRCFLAGLAGWDVPIPDGGWQNSGIIEANPNVELAWGLAWRILDAQYLGVPQRRRRIFVVGYLGDWRRAAAVLFERHSLSGNPPPRREKGQGFAADVAPGLTASGRGVERAGESRGQDPVVAVEVFGGNNTSGPISVAACLNAKSTMRGDFESETFVLTERGRDGGSSLEYRNDGTANAILTPNGGRNGFGVGAIAHCFDAGQSDVCQYGDQSGALGTDCGHSQAVAFSMKDYGGDAGDISPTLRSGAHDKSHANAGAPPAVAFTVSERANSFAWEGAVNPTLNAHPHSDTSGLQYGVRLGSAVRRLTPLECERLQGFPDDFTLVPYRKGKMADGPRYKMLGNSMAVPVLRWIGERIKTVEDLCAELGLAA